jgi:hypothetical protein
LRIRYGSRNGRGARQRCSTRARRGIRALRFQEIENVGRRHFVLAGEFLTLPGLSLTCASVCDQPCGHGAFYEYVQPFSSAPILFTNPDRGRGLHTCFAAYMISTYACSVCHHAASLNSFSAHPLHARSCEWNPCAIAYCHWIAHPHGLTYPSRCA